MKTNLNRTISTQDEAEDFLNELFENKEYFNPDPEKRHFDNHTTWLERDSDHGEDY